MGICVSAVIGQNPMHTVAELVPLDPLSDAPFVASLPLSLAIRVMVALVPCVVPPATGTDTDVVVPAAMVAQAGVVTVAAAGLLELAEKQYCRLTVLLFLTWKARLLAPGGMTPEAGAVTVGAARTPTEVLAEPVAVLSMAFRPRVTTWFPGAVASVV